MIVTAILKNLTDSFFNGYEWQGEHRLGFLQIPDAEKFAFLRSRSVDLNISIRIGHSHSFRDQVELNQILRRPHSVFFKLEPRRATSLPPLNFPNYFPGADYMTKPLLPTERAASLLLAKHVGSGFYPCSFYPGATIRNGLARLESLGFIDSSSGYVTDSGKSWLSSYHLSVASMPAR